VAERLVIAAGVLLNVLLLQIPLFVRDVPYFSLIADPPIIVFLSLVTVHTLWEGVQSMGADLAPAVNVRGAVIPYLTGFSLLLLHCVLVVEFAFLDGGYVFAGHRGKGLILLGAVLMVVGIWVRVRAIGLLGSSFTSHICLVHNHTLFRGGLYGLVRHPSETGMLLIACGACAVMSSVVGCLLVFLVLYPLSRVRVAYEDRMLHESFGEAFESYARSTPAYLPRVRFLLEGTTAPLRDE